MWEGELSGYQVGLGRRGGGGEGYLNYCMYTVYCMGFSFLFSPLSFSFLLLTGKKIRESKSVQKSAKNLY
jgi:hypothetical protein